VIRVLRVAARSVGNLVVGHTPLALLIRTQFA
jgi:hypothetical protein